MEQMPQELSHNRQRERGRERWEEKGMLLIMEGDVSGHTDAHRHNVEDPGLKIRQLHFIN